MRRALLIVSALLFAAGCRPRPTGSGIYGPWEEGLTLVYEDPSLPTQEAREASRFQLRVHQGLMDAAKPGEIKLTENTFQSSYTYTLRYERGGKALFGEDGKLVAWVLPQGFPEGASTWSDPGRGLSFQIVGRQTWEGAPIAAAVRDRVLDPTGVWVETQRKDGLRRRTLYLQDLGEVETQEWQKDRWVAINRLVSRGFTDLPAKAAR